MNKWQIICPVVAMLIAGLVVGVIALRGQHRGFINVASRAIGSDLIASTNSPHLVRVGPGLRRVSLSCWQRGPMSQAFSLETIHPRPETAGRGLD